MSVLKYIDPATGEFVKTNTVKIVDGTPEQLTASGYPDYITPAVMDMVDKVNDVRKKDSIVFIAMSDSHYCNGQTEIAYAAETNASADQATRAAKVLTYLVKPDFVAHLGDVGCGDKTTTPDMLKRQIEEFNAMLLESRSDVPVFIAIGNHDTGIYYHYQQGDGAAHTLAGDFIYRNFTAYSASADTVIAGKENGGYCYRDFPDKKLRVFLLNTSESMVANQTETTTHGAQRLWLANALRDLNTKEDATEWSFIILSHYPADYGSTSPLSDLLKAYVEGANYTIRDAADGTNQSGSFAGYNGAKMIAQFHGHLHNLLTDKLYSGGTQYDAHRLCIPNGEFYRHNYYGEVNGINYQEEKSYPKTAGTANGTSFTVNVVNPDKKIIYSFCYGAGYDRMIGYGSIVYHSITADISNVALYNNQRSVEHGGEYLAHTMPHDGYELKTVKITMGGKDITSTAYVGGTIHISEVTDDVVVTMRAQQPPNFTNLVPTSVDVFGTPFKVDGPGYDNGVYLSKRSDGTVEVRTNTASVTTGYIGVKPGAKVVRVAGEGLSIDTDRTRILGYDDEFNCTAQSLYKHMAQPGDGKKNYNGHLIDEAATLFTVKLEEYANLAKCAYLRVCVNGDGADLIVTVDEEITYGG